MSGGQQVQSPSGPRWLRLLKRVCRGTLLRGLERLSEGRRVTIVRRLLDGLSEHHKTDLAREVLDGISEENRHAVGRHALDRLPGRQVVELVHQRCERLALRDHWQMAQAVLGGLHDEAVVHVIADRVPLLAERCRIELAGRMQLTAELDAEVAECEEHGIHLSFPCPWRHKREVFRQPGVPLIVGPWLSEVGFELLYWIPLLRHFQSRHGLSATRVFALSRGGAGSWYAGLAGGYLDVFDLCSPEEFLAGNRQREASQHGKKQFQIEPFEERLVRAAADRLGLKRYACIHPSLMYRFFKLFWQGVAPGGRVTAWCDHSPSPHVYPRVPGVPFDDYVAVKFYHSDCFPATAENAAFVNRLVARLARTTNVVLLNTGLVLDDHSDAECRRGANVFDATPLMTPRTNLEVQSALVAHARGLYCTYGGFSYLGPLLGVPTQSFYSHARFVTEHLEAAYRVFNRDPAGGFSVTATAALSQFLDAEEAAGPRRKAV